MYLGMAVSDPSASTSQLGSFPPTGKRLLVCSRPVCPWPAGGGSLPRARAGHAAAAPAGQRLRSCRTRASGQLEQLQRGRGETAALCPAVRGR